MGTKVVEISSGRLSVDAAIVRLFLIALEERSFSFQAENLIKKLLHLGTS